MIKSIFIFRRDFRLFDNTSLIKCSIESDEVYPIFIFTPEQINFNKFKSNNAIQFMIESLDYLNKKLKKRNSKLHIFYGYNIDILKKIVKDYTPYSRKRDKKILNFCKKNNIECILEEDYLLYPVKSILTDGNTVYQKYTPFMRKAKKNKVRNINKKRIKNLKKKNFKFEIKEFIKHKKNDNILLKGGRKNALKQLKKIGL
jgi:deoxyribodipyrimidine photo-lyase